MNETNMEMMEEVVEAGTEIVSEVAKNNDLLKKIGTGTIYAAAGIAVYEGGKRLVKFIKSKVKKAKDEKNKSETSEEKSESNED